MREFIPILQLHLEYFLLVINLDVENTLKRSRLRTFREGLRYNC
jgi:hypothetical protein